MQSVGGASAPDFSTLSVANDEPPVLGDSFDLVAGPGPAGHNGVLFVGGPVLPTPPIPPFVLSGADFVGLFTGTAIGAVAVGPSGITLPIGIPNVAAYEGATLRMQVVWINGNGTLPLQFSNAIQLVLGTDDPH